jgi:hypothetical protein
MFRMSLAGGVLLSAVAAAVLGLPGVASADGSNMIPPNCYKHPITGEILCPTPPPRLGGLTR